MLKTLAINSFPAYGNAGLKSVMSVLGHRVVPVPSLILSGLGNIPQHRRFSYPFEANLNQTLLHLRDYDEQIIFYVGYLGDAAQVAVIKEAISSYRNLIKSVIIDPVCGDNGKAYVPESIIDKWSSLLEVADWATPNVTEVKLLSGKEDLQAGISSLQNRFPKTNWIITSYPYSDKYYSNHLITSTSQDFLSKKLPQKISGAGDTFTSLFIKAYFYDAKDLDAAMQSATEQTLALVVRD